MLTTALSLASQLSMGQLHPLEASESPAGNIIRKCSNVFLSHEVYSHRFVLTSLFLTDHQFYSHRFMLANFIHTGLFSRHLILSGLFTQVLFSQFLSSTDLFFARMLTTTSWEYPETCAKVDSLQGVHLCRVRGSWSKSAVRRNRQRPRLLQFGTGRAHGW